MSNSYDKNISLDSPRVDEINNFLNMMLRIAKENNTLLSSDDVYYFLCRCSIKKSDRNKKQEIEKLFYTWIERFKNTHGINVFRSEDWKYFCQFTNNSRLINGRDIKLYIPMDYEHLSMGVCELFEYMASLNMAHASKVGMDLRNDNVVVRLPLTDRENVYKIIDFCTSNPYIRSGMNKTNPFVPNYNGIGVMYEEGFSYNYEMASAIATFINHNLHKKSVSINDFNVEFDSLIRNNIYYNSIKDAYSEAIGLSKGKFQKNSNFKYDVSIDNNQKESIFRESVLTTYSKYGIGQVKLAISKVIYNDNYGYFTSAGRDLRYQLKSNVDSKEMFNIMFNVVSRKFGVIDGIDLDSLIDKYISITLNTSMVSNLNAICNATLQKYGSEQLKGALSVFYHYGVTDRFTRHSLNPNDTINYRDMLSGFDKDILVSTIVDSFSMSGVSVEYKSVDELICSYVDYLLNGKNLYDVSEGPRI